MSKVWLVTGCSSGLGRALAEAIVESGDRLIATARRRNAIEDLEARAPDKVIALDLDVTDEQAISRTLAQGLNRFGRLDVLVNNAGSGTLGAIEECSAAEIRALYETNVFGVMNVTRAVLPVMREQGAGHLMFITSAGAFGGYPATGVYCSTKAAVDSLANVLAKEVGALGITVSMVAPGLFRTDFRGRTMTSVETNIPDYKPLIDPIRERAEAPYPPSARDPKEFAAAVLRIVSEGPSSRRLAMGDDALTAMRAHIEALQHDLDASASQN